MIMFIKKTGLFLFALVLVVGTFSLGSKGSAHESLESTAKQVVKDFLVSMESGNFNKAASLVVDNRFSSTDEQIKEYQNYSSTRSFASLEIASVDVENESSLFVNLKDTSNSAETGEAINVKAINGIWKIALGDDRNATSPGFSVQTLADHYSYNGLQYGAHYTSNLFSIPSGVSNVVVQGWQYSSNSYPSNVSYQLAQKSWLGYTTYGTAVDVNSDGEFTRTLSGAFAGSGFCIRIFVGNSSNVSAAGNVMYNP
jgi:hypothetical protein